MICLKKARLVLLILLPLVLLFMPVAWADPPLETASGKGSPETVAKEEPEDSVGDLEEEIEALEKAFEAFPDYSVAEGITLINPSSGFIRMDRGHDKYFRYSATLLAKKEGSVEFTPSNCVLFSPGGTPFDRYYLRIWSRTEGTKLFRTGRVVKKSFRVVDNPDRPFDVTEWNTARLASSNSKIRCQIPAGGYLAFDVIWKVPNRFYLGGVKLIGKTVRPSRQTVAKKKKKEIPQIPRKDIPKYRGGLRGEHQVLIDNPNSYRVELFFRSKGLGKDVKLSGQSDKKLRLPDGDHDIYLVYSTNDKVAYESGTLKLRGRGARIEVLETEDGNLLLEIQ